MKVLLKRLAVLTLLSVAGIAAPLDDALLQWRPGTPQSVPPSTWTPGEILSLYLHLQAGARAGELATLSEKASHPVLSLETRSTPDATTLGVRFYSTARPKPLVLTAPLRSLGVDRPHDIVVRYAGAKLELFVDGVLLDEEWPMGVAAGSAPLTLRVPGGGVDRVALWGRKLSDVEIQAMSGGGGRDVRLRPHRARQGPLRAGTRTAPPAFAEKDGMARGRCQFARQ